MKNTVQTTLFKNTFRNINFEPKLFTAHVKCNGTVTTLSLQKRQRNSFSKFKFSLKGGDLVFCRFAFNHAVHFRPKMAVTFEIPSSKAYQLTIYPCI